MKPLLIPLCALLLSAAAHAAEQGVTVTQLLSTATTATDQPLEVPAHPQLVVSTYNIAPGAKLPVHKHPYARYAYVVSGTLAVVDTETGKRYDYKTGDFIAEMRGVWHYGENTGTTPLKLLVIDQLPAGTTANTVIQHGEVKTGLRDAARNAIVTP